MDEGPTQEGVRRRPGQEVPPAVYLVGTKTCFLGVLELPFASELGANATAAPSGGSSI